MRSVVLLAWLLLAPIADAAETGNLVKNPGFEAASGHGGLPDHTTSDRCLDELRELYRTVPSGR